MKLGNITLVDRCAGGVKLPQIGKCPECGANNDQPCGRVLAKQRETLADLRAALTDLLSDIDSMKEIPMEISGTALCKARQAVERARS